MKIGLLEKKTGTITSGSQPSHPHTTNMSSVEPLEIQSQNTEYLLVIKEEMEELEKNFDEALSTIDALIELESLDPEHSDTDKEKFIEIIRDVQAKKNSKFQLSSVKIFESEKKVHWLYRDGVKELHDANYDSFAKVSQNFDHQFDRDLKEKEAQQLDKTLGNLLPIELESNETLALDLSKDEIHKILDIEKSKRAKLSLLNERIYEPEIKALKSQYETWGSRDNELKRFLINDIGEVNKKIQIVKRIEGQ